MENIMLYGGASIAGIGLLLLLILVPVFRSYRRKLIQKIENSEEI